VIASERRARPPAGRAGRADVSALPVGRQVAGWAVALACTAALTAVLTANRDHFGTGTPYVLYQLVVVLAALVGGAWPAITAAALSAAALNWYFSPPLHTWTIDNSDDLVALAAFVVAGILVGLVVTALARSSSDARRGRAEAEALAHVAAGMVAAPDPLRRTLERIRATLELDGIALFGPSADAPLAAAGEATDPATDRVVPIGDAEMVIRGKLTGDGERVLRPFTAQLAATLERRRLHDAAERAAVLAETDRLRTALLRAVSHDLRSPLASIKASVTSLLQGDVAWSPLEEREFLSTIDEETDRLNGVIGNLLDAGRLEVGAVQPAARPVAIDDVVASALASISGLGTAVAVDVPADLPLVRADPALLERALANLITNADHASPEDGMIDVSAYTASGVVELRVIDHGSGLPDPQRAQMFMPFQRLGDSGTSDGVGLGLAVAKGLIEAMNGQLAAQDTPGGGLTMVVTLPIADADER
jgi:two-component system, OmpR family, sensor histidine kinase KdpD